MKLHLYEIRKKAQTQLNKMRKVSDLVINIWNIYGFSSF